MAKPFTIPLSGKASEPEVEVLGGAKPGPAPAEPEPSLAELAKEDAAPGPTPEEAKVREWGAVRGRGRTLGMHNQLYANTLIFEELRAIRAGLERLSVEIHAALSPAPPKK